MMQEFIREDGAALKLDLDFKKMIRSRPSANPKSYWTDKDYITGVQTKLKRWSRRLSNLKSLGIQLNGARVLDVACGNGIDCLLMGREPVQSVIGIDKRISLFLPGNRGARHRRLAADVLKAVGLNNELWKALCDLPVCLVGGDVTKLPFDDNSFDLILSKSFLEHMIPIESALVEMERVLVPGGLMYHVIDPFFWLRGCHSPGLVDIPWAHARLSQQDYRKFIVELEGEEVAKEQCAWLESLNRFTINKYRQVFDSSSLDICSWKVTNSSIAEEILDKNPEVLDTVLDGISRDDLVNNQIKVLARKKAIEGILLKRDNQKEEGE